MVFLPPLKGKDQINLWKINKDGVAINIMEEMFNNQEEQKSNDDAEDRGFPSTPWSVKLSNKASLTEAFRVSLFIYDFCLFEDEEDNEKDKEIDFWDNKMNIFLDDIQNECDMKTNLLLKTKDINTFASSIDDLKGSDKMVMNIPEEQKIIDTELEEEFQTVAKARSQKTQEMILKRAEELKKAVPDQNPKYYRMSLTNDATLFYAALFNQLLVSQINNLLFYNDEYIASVSQPSSLINFSRQI